MSHPINGDYVNGGYNQGGTINFRISSHDEAKGKFWGTLFENQYTISPTIHTIEGWFKFNRATSSTSFSFHTPTDSWVLESPNLESKNQFAIMNAIRTPEDKSLPTQNLTLEKVPIPNLPI